MEHIYFIDDPVLQNVISIFNKIREEIKTDYSQKLDILRCYVHLLVHEAMKAAPPALTCHIETPLNTLQNSSSRCLTDSFPLNGRKESFS